MHRWVSASDSVGGMGGGEVALLQGSVIRLSGALDYRGEEFVYLTQPASFVLFLLWSLTYGWMVGWLGGWTLWEDRYLFLYRGMKSRVFMYCFITDNLLYYVYCYYTVSASNGLI